MWHTLKSRTVPSFGKGMKKADSKTAGGHTNWQTQSKELKDPYIWASIQRDLLSLKEEEFWTLWEGTVCKTRKRTWEKPNWLTP